MQVFFSSRQGAEKFFLQNFLYKSDILCYNNKKCRGDILKKSILSIGLCLLMTGCSPITETNTPEPVQFATNTASSYTQIAAPETETIRPTLPPPETKPETEPETVMPMNLYDKLYEELSQFHNTVNFDHSIDSEELSRTVNQLEREHPEIFWLNGYSMRYSDDFAEVKFHVINGYSPDTLRQMSDALNMTVEEILRTISPDSSDYDKALQIHDYLISNTDYDQSAVTLGKGDWSTAYGCLIQGKAVCQGYAAAFQLIMNRLGLECGICTGDAKGEAHAWNYIRINQQYYWVDVTWDDPVAVDGESRDWIHHGYFLINDEMLSRSRTFDADQFQPVCSSLDENYYMKNQNYLWNYNFYDIDNRLTQHVPDGKIEVMFADAVSYQTAIEDLFGSSESIWSAQIFQSTGGKINYQHDDDMYILRLVFQVN